MTHTVDEVSDLLDVPRPTLYRYLREYSIPHLRRSGKIYVPEESFERIKEVRELHKEGLGTESVRRRLRGESNLDIEGIEERLDRLLEALEGLRGDLKPANEPLLAQEALQTILARQDLLLSEVSNLAVAIEDLAPTNGRLPKAASEEPQKQEVPFEQPEERLKPPERDPTVNGASLVQTSPGRTKPPPAPARSSTRRGRRFGVMARRRRRGALAILLLALLAGIALTAHALNGAEGSGSPQEGASREETSAPPQEAAPSNQEEVVTPAEGPEATIQEATVARNRREPAEYAKDVYGGSTPQRPLYGEQYPTQYQPQYAAPELLPQGQYTPSQYDDLPGDPAAPAAQNPAPY